MLQANIASKKRHARGGVRRGPGPPQAEASHPELPRLAAQSKSPTSQGAVEAWGSGQVASGTGSHKADLEEARKALEAARRGNMPESLTASLEAHLVKVQQADHEQKPIGARLGPAKRWSFYTTVARGEPTALNAGGTSAYSLRTQHTAIHITR